MIKQIRDHHGLINDSQSSRLDLLRSEQRNVVLDPVTVIDEQMEKNHLVLREHATYKNLISSYENQIQKLQLSVCENADLLQTKSAEL
jgi:hypothetical protein